jgi:predicted alpha/beta-hydrolase family hydrolase
MSKFSFYMAHGAGLGHTGGFLDKFAVTFCRTKKMNYLPLTFDYMTQMAFTGKRRPPTRFPQLVDEYKATLSKEAKKASIIVAGKSMGGRVASQLSSDERVAGIVCLGFPFYQQGKPEKHRLAFLEDVEKPCLIIQGTRDAMGKPDWVKQQSLNSNITLHWFEGADHDFNILKSIGKSQEQVMEEITQIIHDWASINLS